MSNTYKHKINAKYKNKIISEVPMFVEKFWYRQNFDVGYFKRERIKKRIKILNYENKQYN